MCFTTEEQGTLTVEYGTAAKFKQSPVGLTYVQRGSLVFSVPVKYSIKAHEYRRDGVERKKPYCDYDYLRESDWNFAYSCAERDLKANFHGIGEIPFSSEQPPVTVSASVRDIEWDYAEGYRNVAARLPSLPAVPISEQRKIELYPYGCAKLRMTEIPECDKK